MKYIFLISLFVASASICTSQTISKVSLIGENEQEYEQMMAECSSSLLSIADNSMDKAFNHWTSMLAQMESSAENQGLDIKGVKVWMNLFWDSNGSIKKMVYYPKPNSKNIDFDKLTAFFESFAENFSLEIDNSSCFSHYGSASFPILTKVSVPNEK
ncbi:MAG: hypothetical protein P1U56_01380 [Saprospiraceae bacterium]|nr:hypothetical protein [Saprospiraceae bacterium]